MGKFDNVAKEMIKNVGGEENIDFVTNCMTRVRFEVTDESKVDQEALKRLPDVFGIHMDAQVQVIVGPGKAQQITENIKELLASEASSSTETIEESDNAKERLNKIAKENRAKIKSKQETNVWKQVLKMISNIFVPLAPAFIAVGIVAGLEAALNTFITQGTFDASWFVQFVGMLGILRRGVLSYLVIYVGISSAIEFKANQWLGGALGAVVLLTGMNPDQPIANLLTGEALKAGQGGVIGVVFAVWILSILEKKLHRIMPVSIDLIVTSFVALFISAMLTMIIIMPVAGIISDGLLFVVMKLLSIGGAFAGFVLAALWLPAVMLGVHHIMTPIHIELINQTGMSTLLPILTMAGGGQVGASIALWIKCKKNRQLVDIIKAGLPAGILGIGEPLIYGVTLPLGKPFLTACLGAGFGGAFLGAVGKVGSMSIGATGVLMIPLIADQKWVFYLVGLIISYAAGFIITYFFGVTKAATEETFGNELLNSDAIIGKRN